MLPQAMVVSGTIVWMASLAVSWKCWKFAKRQEIMKEHSKDVHYLPELAIVVRHGRRYHMKRCEHISDRAVHPVEKSGTFNPARRAPGRLHGGDNSEKRKVTCYWPASTIGFWAGTWTGVLFSLCGMHLSGKLGAYGQLQKFGLTRAEVQASTNMLQP